LYYNVSYVYQVFFHFANFLDDFEGSGPGRSKSIYETILCLIRSFSGRRCGGNPLILLQNKRHFKDLPTTFTSCSVSFDLSSSKSTLFSGTFSCLFYFSHIVFVLPASSTSMLMWTAKIKSACSHHYLDF